MENFRYIQQQKRKFPVASSSFQISSSRPFAPLLPATPAPRPQMAGTSHKETSQDFHEASRWSFSSIAVTRNNLEPAQRYAIERPETPVSSVQGEVLKQQPVEAESDVLKENTTGLPDHLKVGIEHLSGHSLDNVHVHYNSSQPSQVSALAYTQGTNIYVGPGQEQHLAHETWHVVQQKQGRVKPTLQMKGIEINDEEGLEREADVMGEQAQRNVDSSSVPAAVSSNQTGHRTAMPIQRKGMTEIMRTQVAREDQIGSEEYKQGQYTTVGLEFDIAQTAIHSEKTPNILQGLSHVELAKSDFRWNTLPYILETDAGNVLEFVTPPFYVATRPPLNLPIAADLQELIGAIREELKTILKVNMTLSQMMERGWGAFQIGRWELEDLGASIDWHNWSHRAQPGSAITPQLSEVGTIPIAKLTLDQNPQINIAASAQAYQGVLGQQEARIDDSSIKRTFDESMEKMQRIINDRTRRELFSYSDDVQKRILGFMDQLTRVLAQQYAVPYIHVLAKQQQVGWGGGSVSKKFNEIANSGSFIKDITNVWLKTDLISYGVALLKREDWPLVHDIIPIIIKEVSSSKFPIGKFPKDNIVSPDYDIRPQMVEVLDKLLTQTTGLVDPRPEEEYAASTNALLTAISNQPKRFNEHNEEILGVRQDTFISPKTMAALSRKLKFGELLQVIEVRTPTAFLKWLENEDKKSGIAKKDTTSSSSDGSSGKDIASSSSDGSSEKEEAKKGEERFSRGSVEHWANSCYLNAVVHLLASHPAYMSLLNDEEEDTDEISDLKHSVSAIIETMRQPDQMVSAKAVEDLITLFAQQGIIVNLDVAQAQTEKQIKSASKAEETDEALTADFLESQQDAAEVLQNLLDRLQPNNSVRITERRFMQPKGGGKEDIRGSEPEQQSVLHLAIPDEVGTIEEALRHHTRVEKDVPLRKPGEGENSPHNTQLLFTSLPDVLTIALRRFSFNAEMGQGEKIERPIVAGEELIIPKVCLLPPLREQVHRYRLIHFVHQYGSLSEGHYIPYHQESPDTKWERHDDISGPSTPTPDLLEDRRNTAYIYTYQRI